MRKEHAIELAGRERIQLMNITSKGKRSVREVTRARALLMADDHYTDAEIVEELGVSLRTVERIRKRYAQEGLCRALQDASRPGQPRRLDLEGEIQLITLACTAPPRGHRHWTGQLLAERLIKERVVPAIGRETVRQVLRANGVRPWGEKEVVHSEADRRVPSTYGGHIDRL